MNKSTRIVTKKYAIIFLVICSVFLSMFSTVPAKNIIDGISGCSEGVITGIVTDAETSYPIPNALMTLKYHNEVHTELTDSNGKYMFTGVPICFCLKNVSASKEGYEGQYKMVAVHKITYVDFSLKPLGNNSEPYDCVITGIVTDSETENPIPDALMILKYHDIVRTEFTDDEGYYTFTNVPNCFCLKNVSASKKGYESQYKLVAVSGVTYVNFSLNPDGNNINPYDCIITGIVTDSETGNPIPDALMTLKYHDVIRIELTDSKGQYTFTNVPNCFCLKNVSASKNGYESQYKLVAVSQVTYVNFSLDPSEDDPGNEGSDIASSKNDKGEIPFDSKSYLYAIVGIVGIFAIITVVGIIYVMKR
ncbi:MAG: hypothetical protein A7315_06770 [Candidatus Altiarchaeales archaeon WOR_SM1_79]|nr:MAG: hypothetical protein A7315_06770 [Candidatus Altiarchaeales archaeon WOR_SM1_79]